MKRYKIDDETNKKWTFIESRKTNYYSKVKSVEYHLRTERFRHECRQLFRTSLKDCFQFYERPNSDDERYSHTQKNLHGVTL